MDEHGPRRGVKAGGFILFCIGLWLIFGNYSDNNLLLLAGIACMGVGGIIFVVVSFQRDRHRSSNEYDE